MSSFLAAILSTRGQVALATNALQLVELLLVKLPDSYQCFFRREGVMHEIERLAAQPIVSATRTKKDGSSRTPRVSEESSGILLPSTSSSAWAVAGISQILREEESATASRASTVSGDETPLALHATSNLPIGTGTPTVLTPVDALAEDILTRRARHLRDQYASPDSEPAIKARDALKSIRSLVARLDEVSSGRRSPKSAHELEGVSSLIADVAALFSDAENPLSSFELLESGLVDGLLRFATDSGTDRCEPSFSYGLSVQH